MIENESVQCYKLSTYSSNGNSLNENIPSYSISLSESQGFLWNQDLFASSYQQSEAGVHNMMSMSDDVIVGNDDYNSDVEIVTEVVKVGNYGEDDDDDDDDDDEEDEEEHEVGGRSSDITDRGINTKLSANDNRDTESEGIQHDEYDNTDEDEGEDEDIFISDL
ncbi:hypothetical protein PMKS-002969 [Pichia membranifaciens]|uniref:Uncharacterized protein n=1 Tax=Pichia membranifaciens TaxID=4926 RepID=A0A1Q2YIU1_9ASCO|nr:hypothetical protein PMKS-002969 [Pichia membranifaciens]